MDWNEPWFVSAFAIRVRCYLVVLSTNPLYASLQFSRVCWLRNWCLFSIEALTISSFQVWAASSSENGFTNLVNLLFHCCNVECRKWRVVAEAASAFIFMDAVSLSICLVWFDLIWFDLIYLIWFCVEWWCWKWLKNQVASGKTRSRDECSILFCSVQMRAQMGPIQ